jgi:hypothetical protein
MNKLISSVYVTQTIVLSLLIASAGFISFPSPSKAQITGPEVLYRNCAELQKHLNENNPGDRYEGFEKVKMIRRKLGYSKYTVFCNGGIVTDGAEGTICRGYIGYSFSPIGGAAHYYAAWGKTNGLPNFNDTGKGNYCRRI